MPRQQRTWRVRRSGVQVATGQQRWDRAYQLLLRWAATDPPASAEAPAPLIPPETSHARSDLRPCLDQPPGRAPDLSLRWVVNGLEFGCVSRSLRGILVWRVPTSRAVPGGSADGEDRLGC